MLTKKSGIGRFGDIVRQSLEFIDKHPRIILLLAWPVFTLMVAGLVWIIWQGPWMVTAAIQMKQLDILGYITGGIIVILGLNQLAQSSSFFGKLGLKVGSFFDLNADMEDTAEKKTTPEELP